MSTTLFCVAITLPDADGSGWAELFGTGFYLSREPIYMSYSEAEETRDRVRKQVPGTVTEIQPRSPVSGF